MAALLNHNNFKPYKPTTAMELKDLEHNEKLLLKQLAILQDKVKIYKKQLSETKKQIKKWKI